MKLIIHAVRIKATRDRVYTALATRAGLAGWWTTDVRGESSPGATLAFRFADVFAADMRVLSLEAQRIVKWTCVSGVADWLNDLFTFELSDDGEFTLLMFRQEYARELDDRTYGEFNYNWGYYLTSLKALCETGTGAPFGGAKPA